MKISLHLIVVFLVIFGAGAIQAETTVLSEDFEGTIGDWMGGDAAIDTAVVSTDQALSGTQSVKLIKDTTGTQLTLQNDVFTDLESGDTLTFNLYVSTATVDTLNGIQIYWQDGDGWAWHAPVWVTGSGLTKDAWNELSVVIPVGMLTQPLQRVGIQVLWKAGSEKLVDSVYVDDISVVRPDFMIAIDAEKDAWYDNMPMMPDSGYLDIQAFCYNDNGRPAGNEDLSVQQWCAWDDTWFYIYTEVTDDIVAATSTNAYANDCIEIKIDGEATDSTGGISQELRLNALLGDETTAAKDTLATIPANAKMWAKKLTDTGYVLEFAIRWDSLDGSEVIDVAVDSLFGMGIGYHDNDNHLPAEREASVTWAAVPLDAIWNTPKYHGTVTFMKNHRLKFDATNHMTGVHNPLPFDGTVPALGVIDGKMDPFYSLLSGPDDGYLQIKSYAFQKEYGLDGAPSGDADFSAKLWAAWDATWFYVYLEVTDDTISCSNTANSWENDAIELKIDGVPTGTETDWHPVSAACIMTSLDSTDNPGGLTDDPSSAYGDANVMYARNLDGRANGEWTLEFAVKLDTLGGSEKIHAAVDSVFGLGINLIDNDVNTASNSRNSGLIWASRCTDLIWNNVDEEGTVKFLADNKVQFIAKNNFTGQVNPVPYDGTPLYINAEDGILDPFYKTMNKTNGLADPAQGHIKMRNWLFDDLGRPGDDEGITGTEARDADLSGEIWTAWDDTYWYIYNRVWDATIAASDAANAYNNDCIEIKVDPVIDDSAAGQVWDTRLTILGAADTDMATDSLNSVADSLKKIYRGTMTGGYNLEMAIAWAAVARDDEAVNAAIGTKFGAAFQDFDNDGAGRVAAVQWAARMGDAVWNEVKYMGTVEFLAGNKLGLSVRENAFGYENPHYTLYDGQLYEADAVEDPIVGTPLVFDLKQNYPNPFNPVTNINYTIPEKGKVSLMIYNILGQRVATLIDNKTVEAGSHILEFKASHLATGMYFYRIEFKNKMLVKKMMLVK